MGGRKDDIINTFGFRVSPHEIERVVKTHNDVADCVAFGLDLEKDKTIVAIAVIGHQDLSEEQNDENTRKRIRKRLKEKIKGNRDKKRKEKSSLKYEKLA